MSLRLSGRPIRIEPAGSAQIRVITFTTSLTVEAFLHTHSKAADGITLTLTQTFIYDTSARGCYVLHIRLTLLLNFVLVLVSDDSVDDSFDDTIRIILFLWLVGWVNCAH